MTTELKIVIKDNDVKTTLIGDDEKDLILLLQALSNQSNKIWDTIMPAKEI